MTNLHLLIDQPWARLLVSVSYIVLIVALARATRAARHWRHEFHVGNATIVRLDRACEVAKADAALAQARLEMLTRQVPDARERVMPGVQASHGPSGRRSAARVK